MQFEHEDPRGRVTYLGTGISNLKAAKRDLRNRFRQAPLEPVQQRPGRLFYVSARRGGRTVLLLGPYVSHMTALERAPRARGALGRVPFVAVGTCSLPTSEPTRFGR